MNFIRMPFTVIIWLGCAVLIAGLSFPPFTSSHATEPWYGKSNDVALALELWLALHANRVVGPDRINVRPFAGQKSPSIIRQVWAATIKVGDRRARAVVRANHTKPGATLAKVYDNPNAYLTSYTVMFQAEKGYDPKNNDMFWVKYAPSGQIDKNANGVAIAGRVDSPSGFGCVSCHRKLGGQDFEVLTSK